MTKEVNYDDFEYVVQRVVAARICFGSTLERNTNPIGKGLSPFQMRYASEIRENLTPQTYDLSKFSEVNRLANKVRSNRGVGGLADGAPRTPKPPYFRVPSPGRYDPEPIHKTFKQNYAPFLKKVGRKDETKSKTPGPGSHDCRTKQCLRTKIANNFGRPTMIPAVEERCTPTVSDPCSKCLQICQDDYWQRDYNTFLCHICMQEEKILYEIYTRKELQQFQKLRTCWYRHSHEGTTAHVHVIKPEKLRKRRRLENYLDLYFHSF